VHAQLVSRVSEQEDAMQVRSVMNKEYPAMMAQRVEKQREYQVDYRFNQAGGGADKQLVADGGPGADDAAQRVALRRARIRARPGGPDDRELVADGGPGASAAAQRVEERMHRDRLYRATHRAKHPCLQSTRFIASGLELLAKQQEEFKAWHRHWVSEWRVLEGARNM
jgi:hypothetical protein